MSLMTRIFAPISSQLVCFPIDVEKATRPVCCRVSIFSNVYIRGLQALAWKGAVVVLFLSGPDGL